MFPKVRHMLVEDTYPFEHKFFQLISQDFPFLQALNICNDQPQKDKKHLSTLITFPHLTMLYLQSANVDYAEQLLLVQNAHMPRLVNLHIRSEYLALITNKILPMMQRISILLR